MLVYHGTTARRAERICSEGFLPKKPSRRVWFAESRNYALGRARTQARRAHDRAIVLTCYLELTQLRERLGSRKVFARGGIIAVDGRVPVTVLRSHPAAPDRPTSPHELARWVNEVLGLKPYKGVRPEHPGVDRLSRWVVNRYTSRPNSSIKPQELLAMARRWLPDFFKGIEIDPETLLAHRQVPTIEVSVEPSEEPPDAHEEEALDCIASDSSKQRLRGLRLLVQAEVEDLSDWCAMCLKDESADVVVAALQALRSCQDVDPEIIRPFAASEERRVRAAATAALAKHGGAEALRWMARGLKDPDACVRVETAALLDQVDPTQHPEIFDLALHDPNPTIAERARRLIQGKGFHPTE
jgi:hypothetical protein